MRLNVPVGFALAAAFAGVLSGCGEQRAASPLSPSLLSSPSSEDVRRAGGTLAPRRVDNDGDGNDDGEPPYPPPDPGTEPPPPPDPGTGPTPDPGQPPAEGTPGPVQLTISVVGTFGSGAFAPNPLQAAIGNTIVWMNSDLVPHDIVLDDGTPVGNLAPGQASMPITLAAETMGFHCTFHPSMVGQVTPIPPPPTDAPPTDPSADPPADPGAPPADPPAPPPYDPYGGDPDEPYDPDDYYLKTR